MRSQWRRLLLVCACVICGGVLAVGQPHAAGGRLLWWAKSARACGLGNTATMLANTLPALAFPITPDTPPNTPIGVFGTDYYANQNITFTEDLSKLPTKVDVNAYHWHWTFGDGGKADGYTVQHTYTKPGSYTINIALDDPSNADNSDPNFDNAQINVIAQPFDNPPVASAFASAKYVQLGSSISYDASASKSLIGGNLTYSWNFGDTQVATGPKVAHVFTLEGNGFVALVVQDQRGAKAMLTLPVVVVAELPKAQLNASATTTAPGAAITFDASGSTPSHLPNDQLVKYQWSFGDGGNRTTTQPTTTYTYQQPGTYTVTVQALDQNGYPGTATLQVLVQKSEPSGFAAIPTPWRWAGFLIGALLIFGVAGNYYRQQQERKRLAALAAAKRARRAQSRPRR